MGHEARRRSKSYLRGSSRSDREENSEHRRSYVKDKLFRLQDQDEELDAIVLDKWMNSSSGVPNEVSDDEEEKSPRLKSFKRNNSGWGSISNLLKKNYNVMDDEEEDDDDASFSDSEWRPEPISSSSHDEDSVESNESFVVSSNKAEEGFVYERNLKDDDDETELAPSKPSSLGRLLMSPRSPKPRGSSRSRAGSSSRSLVAGRSSRSLLVRGSSSRSLLATGSSSRSLVGRSPRTPGRNRSATLDEMTSPTSPRNSPRGHRAPLSTPRRAKSDLFKSNPLSSSGSVATWSPDKRNSSLGRLSTHRKDRSITHRLAQRGHKNEPLPLPDLKDENKPSSKEQRVSLTNFFNKSISALENFYDDCSHT